jgi:rubrerythrin
MPELRKVSSTEELLAVAHAMEEEAGRRYRDLAARMRRRGEAGLAELFTFLAGIEGKHAGRIEAQSLQTLGRGPRPVRLGWEVPENFDEEEASSRLLTPYLALAVAVRNEDRAFAFFCYVAAEADNENIRVLAEDLAKEELTHATLLRRERRKAYRNERQAADAARRGEVPATMNDLLRHAVELESSAAAHHDVLAKTLAPGAETVRDALAKAAADEEQTARLLADRLGSVPSGQRVLVSPSLEDGLRILEEVFNFYADVADRTDDEAVAREALQLAEGAVRRLALVRAELGVPAAEDWR